METTESTKQALEQKAMELQNKQNSAPDQIKPAQHENSIEVKLKRQMDVMKNEIALALPNHMDPSRLCRVVLTCIKSNPELLSVFEKNPVSLWSAILLAAQLGLEPNTMGQCYIIPYKNYKTGVMEAQFQIGYRGLLTLLKRSGEIESVQAEVVYEKDFLDVVFGTETHFIHRPFLDGDRGKHKIFYAVFQFKTGVRHIEWMTKDEIDAIRNRSKSQSGPWVTDYEEMGKKTVIKRACKKLPLSIEVFRNIEQDEVVKQNIVKDMTEPQVDELSNDMVEVLAN